VSYEVRRRAIGDGIFDVHVIGGLIGRIKAGDEARRQMWEDLGSVVRGLAGEDPTPTELLLARTAATDWLAMKVYQSEYEAREKDSMSLFVSEHHQRRIDRTHRRMLRSIKTLEVVRRLRRPSAMIKVKAEVANIAQQVNGAPAAALDGA
jgi:hypothetical protein